MRYCDYGNVAMANPGLFRSSDAARRMTPPADTVNDAGGKAYARSDEAALALYALTGTFNSTFYATDETHLERVTELCAKVEPRFLAQLAVYARSRGYMKDLPAFLVAQLAKRDVKLCASAFERVIDNAKMLRNFVQIIRSGTVGRKSLGSRPKALVKGWFGTRSTEALFRQSTGDKPSMADLVKMVHPKPKDDEERAFYGWLIGRKVDFEKLPAVVRAFEAYKVFQQGELPEAPFEMLANLAKSPAQWAAIAQRATWRQLRMNLNTFQRQGVFEDADLVLKLAAKLEDAGEVRRAREFPYNLFAAYKFASSDTPLPFKIALQRAMEVACENVPALAGNVYVLIDASGSMQHPVTGTRKGATSAMRCIDVAALVGSALVRKNPLAKTIVFGEEVLPAGKLVLNPLDSVVTNAEKLAALNLGGTDCSAPLRAINWYKFPVDLAILVSDSESWIDPGKASSTAVMREWATIKARCPNAKLACIDLVPNCTAQVKGEGILSVGGFSDHVFQLLADFVRGETNGEALVKAIKEVAI